MGLGGLGGHPFPPDRMDYALTRGHCMQFSWCSLFACACVLLHLPLGVSPPQYLGFVSPCPDARMHVHRLPGIEARVRLGRRTPQRRTLLPEKVSRARAGCTRRRTGPGKGREGAPSPPRQASHESERIPGGPLKHAPTCTPHAPTFPGHSGAEGQAGWGGEGPPPHGVCASTQGVCGQTGLGVRWGRR